MVPFSGIADEPVAAFIVVEATIVVFDDESVVEEDVTALVTL